jgi:hypothetical protein
MARWKHARGSVAALLVAAAFAGAPAPGVLADEAADKKAAHEAYERGARAFGQGSYAVAAAEFARADELAPAPAALEAALKAAILAEDAVLAMSLADRAEARAPSAPVAAQVARAKDRFAHKVGRLEIVCDTPCSAKVGNETVPLGTPRVYLAGNYVIEITWAKANPAGPAPGAPELFAVQLPGGATMKWKPPSKAPPPVLPEGSATSVPAALPNPFPKPTTTAAPGPAAPPKRALSVAWFTVGTGVTVVSAGLALGFGLDTLSRHAAFAKDPTNEGAAAGQDAQLRTNLFLGLTAATAIATAVIGYFTFRTPSGGNVALAGRPSSGVLP